MTTKNQEIKALNGIEDEALYWRQPNAFARSFTLTLGQNVFAELNFEGLYGPKAVAKTSLGEFNIQRKGFIHPFIDVEYKGEKLPEIPVNFNGGASFIGRKSGKLFEFRCTNLWQYEWSWFCENEPFLVSALRISFTDKVGKVKIAKNNLVSEELTVAVLTAKYMQTLSGSSPI